MSNFRNYKKTALFSLMTKQFYNNLSVLEGVQSAVVRIAPNLYAPLDKSICQKNKCKCTELFHIV